MKMTNNEHTMIREMYKEFREMRGDIREVIKTLAIVNEKQVSCNTNQGRLETKLDSEISDVRRDLDNNVADLKKRVSVLEQDPARQKYQGWAAVIKDLFFILSALVLALKLFNLI